MRRVISACALAPALGVACSGSEFSSEGTGGGGAAPGGGGNSGSAGGGASGSSADASAGSAGAAAGGASGSGGDGGMTPLDSGVGGAGAVVGVDAAETGVVCQNGLEPCGSSCVDLATDAAHCGSCGHDCRVCGGDRARCEDGACRPVDLETSSQHATALALDDQSVFWINNFPSEVNVVPKSGGMPSQLAPQGGFGVAADQGTGGNVYWTTGVRVDAGDIGAVASVSKQGGMFATLATVLGAADDLVADDRDLFFLKGFDPTSPPGIFRVSKAGGGATRVSSVSALGGRLALDSQFVYFTQYWGGQVGRVPKAGGPVATEYAAATRGPKGIAADSTHVYWANTDTGTVHRSVLAANATVIDLATVPMGDGPTGVSLDTSAVYFTVTAPVATSGFIAAVPKTGGEYRVIARAQTNPEYVVNDERCVYWANRGTGGPDGGVSMVAK